MILDVYIDYDHPPLSHHSLVLLPVYHLNLHLLPLLYNNYNRGSDK